MELTPSKKLELWRSKYIKAHIDIRLNPYDDNRWICEAWGYNLQGETIPYFSSIDIDLDIAIENLLNEAQEKGYGI